MHLEAPDAHLLEQILRSPPLRAGQSIVDPCGAVGIPLAA